MIDTGLRHDITCTRWLRTFLPFLFVFCFFSHKNDQHHNSDLCLVKSFQSQAKSCFFFFLLRVYLLPASRRKKE